MQVAFPPRREVLVFGTGAVGAVLGWRLAQNPRVRVSVVCRSNYEAVRSNGISLRTAKWGAGHFHPARVCRSPLDLRHIPFDYVVCANKATNSGVYSSLSGLVRDKTVLVSAQNGVGVEAPLQRSFPENTVLSGIVYIACTQPSPGLFAQNTCINSHSLALGLYGRSKSASHDKQREFSLRDFTSLESSFGVSPDVVKEKWIKQIWNGAFNTMAALSGMDTHEIISSPRLLQLVRRIMTETYQVAVASGAVLDESIVEQMLVMTKRSPPVVPSMLQDARAGKPMEVDSLCGDVSRLASIYGLKAPAIQAMYQSLTERVDVSRVTVDPVSMPAPMASEQRVMA